MRITHIIKSTSLLGVERHLLLLLGALQAQGVDVELVVLAGPDANHPPDENYPPDAAPPPLAALARHKGIAVHVERVPSYPSPALVTRLVAHLRQRRPDLVHLHRWEAEAYGYLAARRAGIRRVVCSSYEATRPDPGGRLRGPQAWLRGQVLARLDRLIAVNQQTYDRALAQGVRPDRLALIPFGVAAEAYAVGKGARNVLCAELGIDPEAALIGMVCALDEVTGLNRALEAVWHLSARRRNAHLLIVGEGAQQAALERTARGYRIADRVHFLGWREDAHAVIAALDVLLLTCQAEDPTMLLLEAAALQTPVIAAAFDGVDTLITEGETGLVVDGQDGLDHITSGLWLLLDNPEMRRQLGIRAREELLGRYGLEPVVRSTLGVYESLLA